MKRSDKSEKRGKMKKVKIMIKVGKSGKLLEKVIHSEKFQKKLKIGETMVNKVKKVKKNEIVKKWKKWKKSETKWKKVKKNEKNENNSKKWNKWKRVGKNVEHRWKNKGEKSDKMKTCKKRW